MRKAPGSSSGRRSRLPCRPSGRAAAGPCHNCRTDRRRSSSSSFGLWIGKCGRARLHCVPPSARDTPRLPGGRRCRRANTRPTPAADASERMLLHASPSSILAGQPLVSGAAVAPAGWPHRTLVLFQHRFGDRVRHAPRRLDQAEHRHDDEEEGEVVERRRAARSCRHHHVDGLPPAASPASRARWRWPRRARRTACTRAGRPPSAPSRCRATARRTARRSRRTWHSTPPSLELIGPMLKVMARRIA